ncbi:MAG: amidohydrolase [Oscillospiraceae bacterium]|nr:amidohydrolase [Oscillospiraceae bacterium]
MQIYEDRHALHQIPELDFQLNKTMAYLSQALSGLSCKVFSPMEGALTAWFDFGAESTIAFRADADALPIAEKTGAAYASQHPGCMHACGHDGHMAILLELARRLDRKKNKRHNVLLVFQPAEETIGGAKLLCETGILQQHRVQALFGLHLWPGIEAGTVFSRPGELMARSSEINADIYGISAHIAKASEGVDAVHAGTYFYLKCMQMVDSLPDDVFRLLKFGKFHSGTVRNALSAHTRLEGSLRAFADPVFDHLRNSIAEIARQTEETFGCRVELSFSGSYPAVRNPEDLYLRTSRAVSYSQLDTPFMTAEDFSWYQKFVPAQFFFLGLGDTPALHADTFDFDESILLKGADFFEALAERFV